MSKLQGTSRKSQVFWWQAILVTLIFVLALDGCIPAHEPDNLHNTPGAPVVIDNGVYEGANFSANIPDGWRVITGEAQAPQSVIFVAPDGKTLIRLIAGTVEGDSVTVENQRNAIIPVTLGNATTVTTVFSSPYSTWTSYFPDFEAVQDSLSSR
ncbi:MAG: hypothetical protein GC179_16325 [Anaerolineaceae bacterium]|nr:hypothetical protein [Anaerolineaceae bacterium]